MRGFERFGIRVDLTGIGWSLGRSRRVFPFYDVTLRSTSDTIMDFPGFCFIFLFFYFYFYLLLRVIERNTDTWIRWGRPGRSNNLDCRRFVTLSSVVDLGVNVGSKHGLYLRLSVCHITNVLQILINYCY